MRRSLGDTLDEPELPATMKLRDCVEVDLNERSAAHRDAWSHLAHIGLPDAKSSFGTEIYARLRAAPLYDPALDLAVETLDGTIASCCICWVDTNNKLGLFEPVGTRHAFRRQGIACALILYGLLRLRAKGMRTAVIGTASFNHPAEAAYKACGFEIIEREHRYEKTLLAD